MPFALHPILRTETALLLVGEPGAEAAWHDTVAALCRAGRPPFVVVLADGPDPAPAERRVKAALAGAGLDAERLLMFGIPGALPASGPVSDAACAAICFVAWRQDCNVLGLPGGNPALLALAERAGAQSGLGVLRGGGADAVLVAPARPNARL